jgi:hypothetical protein
MAQHVLSLEAPDTMNPCILRVVDTSIYDENIEVKCPILEITLPGFNYAVQFGEDKIQPGFIENLTACDLEVQTDGCGTQFNNLPDGIYIIKYSVLCELDLGACEPNTEQTKKLNELRKIRMYLEAAKAKVEVCHEPLKGTELFKYAVKLLDKFECKSCQNY